MASHSLLPSKAVGTENAIPNTPSIETSTATRMMRGSRSTTLVVQVQFVHAHHMSARSAPRSMPPSVRS